MTPAKHVFSVYHLFYHVSAIKLKAKGGS